MDKDSVKYYRPCVCLHTPESRRRCEKMVEVINKYETIFIVDVTKTEDEVNAIVEKMKSLIESNATLERVYGITDGILRYITVRKDEE